MKKFLKTKRMRKILKAARIEYRKNEVRDGVRHIKQTELCSTCDPLNCICRDNQRSSKLINFYVLHNQII